MESIVTPDLVMYLLLLWTIVLSQLNYVLCKNGKSWSLQSVLVQERFSVSAHLCCSCLSPFCF